MLSELCEKDTRSEIPNRVPTFSPLVGRYHTYHILPGTWSHLWFAGVRECPPWCSIVGATVTVHQFFCILHFCHTCSLCRVELVVQFPARGSTQVLLCLFPGVLWLWPFLYSVGPHPVSNLLIYTSVVSRAFMAGAASQAGDADSSRAPGLTSGLQGSVNVHRGALLLVPQWQCISSFVFYFIKGDFHFSGSCKNQCTNFNAFTQRKQEAICLSPKSKAPPLTVSLKKKAKLQHKNTTKIPLNEQHT